MIEIWILYAQISRGKSVSQKFQKFEDFLGVSPLMSKRLYLSLTIYLKLENLHSSAKNVQSNLYQFQKTTTTTATKKRNTATTAN